MSELCPQGEAKDTKSATTIWQGWLDSNQRMRESKSLALPLGYTPVWGLKSEGPEPTLRPFRLEVIWGG